MKYKLLEHENKGIITCNSPVLSDNKHTYYIEFEVEKVSENASYLAVFTSEKNSEYSMPLICQNNANCYSVKIPHELLKAAQIVNVGVLELFDNYAPKFWACPPLKISSFGALRSSMWTVQGDLSADKVLADFAELESKNGALKNEIESLKNKHENLLNLIENINQKQAHDYAQTKKLASALNNAIAIINALQERILELEKGYDPSI